MGIDFIIPLILGAFSILQAGINKQISYKLGFLHTTFIGNTLTFLICLAIFVVGRMWGSEAPSYLRSKESLFHFEWWYLFPAFCGFSLVFLLPLAFQKIGAVKVTIGMIAAQMITSALWDYYVDHLPFNWGKILGITFAILSVISMQFVKY